MNLSVKAKVAAAVTLFTVVLTAVVLGAVLSTVGATTTEGAVDNLRAVSNEVKRQLVVEDGMVMAPDTVFVQGGVYSAVYDEDGHFLCGYVPSAKLDSLDFQAGQTQRLGSWLVLDRRAKVPEFGNVQLRSATDIKQLNAAVEKMWILAIGGLAVIALAAALGSYLIMRRGLRPLDTINSTAASISEGTDLSRRIPVTRAQDEFHALGTTFNGMLDRLERSFDKERRFTDNASHELRTPVAVMLSEADYALGEGRSPEELREALERVRSQAVYMSELTSQLLALARADRGASQLQLEELDLSELCELVGETGAELAAERSIAFYSNVQPGVRVRGDTALLMRMALNLVENAVRYGREGGFIRFELRCESGWAVGSVEDNGIGIEPEELPRIWERFYQVDRSRGGAANGAGLGLAMVEFIVQAHGGEVSVQSVPGSGSTFTWRIPALPNPAQGLSSAGTVAILEGE